MDGFSSKGFGKKGFGRKRSIGKGSSRKTPGKKGFKKQDRKGSEESRKREPRGQWGKSERPKMYEATCHKCRETCSVPFKPSGGKPVYCSRCYENQGGSSRPGKTGSYSTEFARINRKLDKLMRALDIE